MPLHQAFRSLLRTPSFTLFAVAALALGIGANVAIFATLRGVLLKPLPFPDPERLVMVWEDASHIGFPSNTPAPANYLDWRKQNTVFEEMGATRSGAGVLTGDGPPEEVMGRRMTASTFRVLGVEPLLGRVFHDADDTPEPRVAVIGYGLWQRRYAASRAIVGRDIVVNGRRMTVIGVMPPSFRFPDRLAEIWMPSAFTPADWARRGSHFLNVVARLKPGVGVERAQAEMSTLMDRLAREYPATNTNVGARVVPLHKQWAGDMRPILIALMAASALVLLIACANVANLLLARATGRQREYAVRLALGAGRRSLIAQVMAETLALAGAGCVAGIALAFAVQGPLGNLVPPGLRGLVRPEIDPLVLAFAAIVSLAATFAAGLIPALFAMRRDVAEGLRQGGRAGLSRHSQAARKALVVAEVAVSVVLLAGTGLLIRSMARLSGEDLGFRPDQLLTMRIRLPQPKYAEVARRQTFFDSVLAEVRALPGVSAAGFVDTLPLRSRGNTSGFAVEGAPPFRSGEESDALIRVSTPGYLPAMGVRLVEGRVFAGSDHAAAPLVAVVNESFARRFWPGGKALGKRIKADRWGPDDPWRTVVGVVSDLRDRGYQARLKIGIYLPAAQAPSWIPETLVLRVSGSPETVAKPALAVVRRLDPEQPVTFVETMETILEEQLAGRRQHLVLMLVFAGLAVTLAAMGIYAAFAFLVTLRWREIGLRMALGAEPSRVVAMVVGAGLRLAGLGLAIGITGAVLLGRAASGLLYGVPPHDPLTLAAAAAAFLAVAAAATYLPSRRAARIDPAVALRAE